MPDVAWLAPDVSSSPVDQPRTTFELTTADSRTVNDSAEPSVAEAASTDTVADTSLSTIVPTAVEPVICHPMSNVVPVRVTLKVSSPSATESSVVLMPKVSEVWPSFTTMVEVDAV